MENKNINKNMKTENSLKPQDKIRLIKLFEEQKDEDKIKEIISFIKDENKGVRAAASKAILSSRSKTTVSELINYLENTIPEIRNTSVEILYSLVDLDINQIAGLLNTGNDDLKIFACQILSYSKSKSAVFYLKNTLNDPNPNVRNAAVLALENIDTYFSCDFLFGFLKDEKDDWVKFSTIRVLEKNAKEIDIDYLIDLIKNENSLIVVEVLNILKNICKADDVIKLVNNYEIIRKKGLENYFNDTVIFILNKNSGETKRFLNNKAVASALINIIDTDKNDWNLYQAISILGKLKNIEYLDIFKKRLSDTRPIIRIACINALSNYKNDDFNSLIFQCLEDNDEEVKKLARSTLQKNNF